MIGRAGFSLVVVALALPVAGGCILADGGGGGAPPPDGVTAGDEPGPAGGGDGTDEGAEPSGDVGGDESDEPGGGAGGDSGTGTGGDGGDSDTSEGIVPPAVTLFVSDLSPSSGAVIILSCSVSDAGGGTVTAFDFTSPASAETITHDGVSPTASALVPPAPQSIIYTCSGTNEAGRGPASNPVTIFVSPD